MSHVVIVGAGPAGACLACILAHRGVEVTLLERRRDFAREFRGEILMPSGVDALQQMGLATVLDEIPTHTLRTLRFYLNGRQLVHETFDDEAFRGYPPLAVSQAAFLEAVVSKARQSTLFQCERGISVRELVKENGRVTGVAIRADAHERIIRADLVIGADGRNSVVRRHLGLTSSERSPPMDIVWCKVPCPADWQGARAYAGKGHLLVAYHTWDDSLQLGWVILKGTFGVLREHGIAGWVEEMAHHVTPDLAAHLRAHLQVTQTPFLLDTISDCVATWSAPGALVIGDAAHTMSPVAGQGVNIALRDAIVAANHLQPLLARDTPAQDALDQALHEIERERMPELQHIQSMQAQPPKLMLSRAWWGEPLRRLAGAALSNAAVRQRAAPQVLPFLYGITDVRLSV